MRKILLMLFVLIAVLAVKAQTDIILADYEAGSIYPDRTTGENWGNLQKNIANPLKDGVNGSDQVVSYNFADTWWGGVHLQNFDEPISLGVYPFVKMKILSDTAKSRQVEVMLKDINDLEKSVTFTLPATSFQSGGGWSDVTFDFSSIAQNTAISFIKEIRIRVEVWSPQGIFYFDDIRFTGPSLVVSSLTLFTESFSDNNWWGSFPAKNTLSFFRTACWGGSALTAPASHYTGTDSLCMDAYNWQPTCAYFYPASVRSTISYLTIKDIGIGGFLNLNVSYNFKWTTAPTSFASAPTIEYSLDGTSWTTVTTSSTLPTANDTWANNVTHPLTGVSGSNLFVRITNNTDGYFMVDEIKVAGDPAFVTSINVETQDGTNAIDVKGATKQMVATVLPSAAKQDVLWSSYNGTGKATLSATGELTAVKNGTVCVIARALDLYGTVRDTQEVVLTNQRYPVTSVDVTGTGGASTITTDNGTLQMLAAYTPNDADTLEVTWSIHPSDADSVTISATGLITAVRNSTVKVIATAKDADHKTDTMDVVITGQVIELESIAVTGSDITTDGGTSQMTATLTPADAENVAIVWSLSSAADSIKATITAGGLVEAFHDGLITVVATDGNSAISSTKDITISGQIVPVESITISTGSSTIIANNGTLTLLVEVLPVDASDKTVIWTIESADADTASIDAGTGEITAIRNGEITVRATSVENNSKYDETTVVITNQIVEPTALTIADATVNSNNTPVQLSIASSTPADADKSVNWSIISSDADTATISSDGLLTPIRNGKVTVKAVSTIVGSVIAEKEITITGQVVELESIAVTGSDITTNGGTSPMTATLTPVDADNVTIVWSLSSAADSAKATITAGGLVEAFRSGAITVVATDGNSSVFGTKTINISGQILVSAINLTTEGNATGIATNGGQLQVYAEVLPADARIKGIVWSIVNTGGSALVNQSGMVTAVADGDVYVKATATDDGAYSDSILLSINGQVSVASVTILTGSTTIDVNDGTLALSTEVLPTDASNKNVIWSIESDDADTASINTSTGVIKAIRNGELTVRATSLANASKFDEVTVVITNQIVEPIAIDIISVNGDSTIISNDGTLALSVNATPTDAVNDVVWSLSISDMEKAMIDSEGLVTAFRNGVIFVQVTSTVAPVSSSFEITIINQIVEPTAITVKGEGNATTITTDGGTLQMEASFAPADADNIVTWSIAIDDAALATISETGLLTAIMNGTVTVVATSNVDGTIKGEAEITISGQTVLVSSITVTGAGDATTITTNAGTLQMSAAVLPADATDKTFDWSVVNGTGEATISASGLLAAVKNGTVTVKATAKDGSLIEGSLVITISGQTVLVSSIAVTGAGDATTITTNAGTLQMSAAILPADATDKTFDWSVVNGTGEATISATGLLAAVKNGTVTVKATAKDGSLIEGSLVITISGQTVLVSSIAVTGAGDATTITTNAGTLQMSAAILPADATEKTVTWSVTNGTGSATISDAGLLTAVENGTVTVIATANDGSAVSGSVEITISGQIQTVLVSSITVTGAGDATTITTIAGTLQMSAAVLPADATDKTVTWSVTDGTGKATISDSGLLTAIEDGTVTVTANANDGSAVSGSVEITISGQIQTVLVSSITVTGAGDATTITTIAGTLQMSAAVLPADATDKTFTWSVTDGTGKATISDTGLLTAVEDGTVTVTATANDGSLVEGSIEITISGQIQTVLVASIAVTGAGDATTITTLAGTLQMSAAVLPADATDKTVTWSVTNGTGSATISDAGLLSAVTDGTVTVTATANDGSGVSGSIDITMSNQVGIIDFAKQDLKIYPNPVNETLNLENIGKVNRIEIINSKGKVVNVANELSETNTINVHSLNQGIYIIRAITDEYIYQAVFVKN